MASLQPAPQLNESSQHVDTVAIVGGTGTLGFGLATRWAHAGINVRIGSRRPDAAQTAATHLPGTSGGENTAVIDGAPVVVVAVPFSAHVETVRSIAKVMRPGQLLIDTTAPMVPDRRGLRPITLWSGSAAEQAQDLVPAGVSVVSAMQTVSAATLQDLEQTLDEDVLICGDTAADKTVAANLIEGIQGLRAVDSGPLDISRVSERITALLVGVNRRYKTPAGIRLTGLRVPQQSPDLGLPA